MESMIFKYQFGPVSGGQAVLREGQVTVFVAAVKFVADNRMAKVSEMDADLMFAAGVGNYP